MACRGYSCSVRKRAGEAVHSVGNDIGEETERKGWKEEECGWEGSLENQFI